LGAEAEEYEARQKELEGVTMPIMTRLYQGVMTGGIVCMPGIAWYARRCLLPNPKNRGFNKEFGLKFLKSSVCLDSNF
jgi:hypothetical protein